jgi:hypothetical protein
MLSLASPSVVADAADSLAAGVCRLSQAAGADARLAAATLTRSLFNAGGAALGLRAAHLLAQCAFDGLFDVSEAVRRAFEGALAVAPSIGSGDLRARTTALIEAAISTPLSPAFKPAQFPAAMDLLSGLQDSGSSDLWEGGLRMAAALIAAHALEERQNVSLADSSVASALYLQGAANAANLGVHHPALLDVVACDSQAALHWLLIEVSAFTQTFRFTSHPPLQCAKFAVRTRLKTTFGTPNATLERMEKLLGAPPTSADTMTGTQLLVAFIAATEKVQPCPAALRCAAHGTAGSVHHGCRGRVCVYSACAQALGRLLREEQPDHGVLLRQAAAPATVARNASWPM